MGEDYLMKSVCPRCNGSGRLNGKPCAMCQYNRAHVLAYLAFDLGDLDDMS